MGLWPPERMRITYDVPRTPAMYFLKPPFSRRRGR
jgi:hypothetical protein